MMEAETLKTALGDDWWGHFGLTHGRYNERGNPQFEPMGYAQEAVVHAS